MSEKFEQWAIVELFGHQRIAGRVTEQAIGGSAFVRVDVPELPATEDFIATQAFTKLYGQGAIYAISFVDQAAALMVARQLRVQPISAYDLRRALQDLPATGGALPAPRQSDLEIDDDERPF
ncbi:hypothetical protein [Paraburkholderia sp. SIMBA_030]|uniref:hypothetical protein n=1 Tax=Paraburkholderia sp. SIMBA_030 TaxID=3085773 RepID=UPI00397C956E